LLRAAAPEGPRLALTEYRGASDSFVLKSVGPDGSAPLPIAVGGKGKLPLPAPLEAPSWSPDGASITFTGTGGRVAGTQGFLVEETQVFVAAADGSGLRALPGTTGAVTPIFAPDGHTIAFARQRRRTRRTDRGGVKVVDERAAVWLVDVLTGATTRVSPWRSWLSNYPTSFSPDGAELLVSRTSRRNGPPSVAVLPLGGGRGAVLSPGGGGVYSPDGSRIAFLRTHDRRVVSAETGEAGIETTTDLYTMRSDGSRARRLTRTPANLEVWPSWDPSGERIAYTRMRGGSFLGFLGFGDAIMQLNADGSCGRPIRPGRLGIAYWGGAWQPGPGREAGPIAC
jgi:Tol biopolymer transport system component